MADYPKEGKDQHLTEQRHRQGVNYLKNVMSNKSLTDAVSQSQTGIAEDIEKEIRGR